MNDIDDQSAALGGKRSYFTGDYAQYNWNSLMSPSLGAHERLELYRQAIQTMAKNPNIPELFRSIYQNAFLPFNSPNVLNLFLKEVDQFSHGESDDIGDAYEYLLSITGAQGDVGQFRTPRHIIKFIVEAVSPTKDDKVLDPAVGTAGFLIAAYNHVRSQHDGKDESGKPNDEKHLTADELNKIHHNYRGFDIDPTMVRTAKVNMYLHGFKTPDIINHDSLSSEEYWNDWYDVILANPPFMTPKGGIQPHKKFSITANRAEVLFVDYIASHLKPTGRAGIVVPEGIIFQSGKAYRELRKNLVENYLYAVVSLPAGVFQPYSGVKTSVLLFDKKLVKERKDMLFVKIENDGYSLGAQRRKIAGDQFPAALEVIQAYQKNPDLNVETALIEYRENLRHSVSPFDSQVNLDAHCVSKDMIAESGDYNLSGDRYKVSELTNVSNYPAVSLGEIAKIDNGNAFKSSEYVDSGARVIRITNVQKGEIVDDSPKFLDVRRISEFSKYELFDNDLLMSLTGNVGRVGLMQKNLLPALLNQRVARIRPDESKILKEYLFHVLNTELFEQAAVSSSSGIAQKNLSTEWLKTYEIPLPPIEIQREIVAELDGYQKIIDAAQTIVKTYKPTIKINPEWEMIKLGKLAKIDNGNAFKSSEYVDTGSRVIRITNVQKGNIVDSQPKYIAIERMDEFYKYVLFEDDLLMSLTGNVGRVGLYPKAMLPGLLNQRVARINPNENSLVKKYLFYMLNRDEFESSAIKSSSGIAQKNMSTEWLKAYEVPLPPIEIQHEVVAKLEAEQKLIDANKKLIEIYQQKIKSKLAEVWGKKI